MMTTKTALLAVCALAAVSLMTPAQAAGQPPAPAPFPAEATPAEPSAEESAAALEQARAKLDRILAEMRDIQPPDAAAATLTNAGDEPFDPATYLPAASEQEAVDRLERTGFAPLVATPSSTAYPYGRSQPVLTCLPSRVCDLRLEPGESIDGLALGDPESWQLTELYEGDDPLTPHVLLKPSRFDVATNLVIATDRRVYHVELRAPAERDARRDEATYDRAVTWWYPEQWAQRRRTAEERARAAAAAKQAAVAQPAAMLDPTALNWRYDVEPPRKRRQRLGWMPTVVLDDGTRTLIRVPAHVREVPAAFGLLDDGSYTPLNASPIRDGWIVLPTVTGEIHLVVGTGDGRRFVRIVNRARSAGV